MMGYENSSSSNETPNDQSIINNYTIHTDKKPGPSQNDIYNAKNPSWQQLHELKTTPLSLFFEGHSSMTSIDSRCLVNHHKTEKWKDLLAFMYTEPSIMFYSNVFLILCSIVLMITSDKYISNLNITRTFLQLESNKPIFFSLYSGFAMMLSCIFALYGALKIRRQLCYCMSGIMIAGALFQFGLGITIINRKAIQEVIVKKEMKFSFLSYGIQSDVTQRWNEFQSELLCCGLYGGNSYKAKQLPLPETCCENKCFSNELIIRENKSYVGCFNVVKKLEAKLLNPVIILTFYCSFLQVTNAILVLNLLRPKPKPRRYHMAYMRTLSLK